jgi:Uma2 family endonuclease
MVHMVAVSESARGLPVAPRGGEEWTTEMLKLLPDDGLRYELIDGILIVSPAPRLPHQRTLGRLFRILRTTARTITKCSSRQSAGNPTH